MNSNVCQSGQTPNTTNKIGIYIYLVSMISHHDRMNPDGIIKHATRHERAHYHSSVTWAVLDNQSCMVGVTRKSQVVSFAYLISH